MAGGPPERHMSHVDVESDITSETQRVGHQRSAANNGEQRDVANIEDYARLACPMTIEIDGDLWPPALHRSSHFRALSAWLSVFGFRHLRTLLTVDVGS